MREESQSAEVFSREKEKFLKRLGEFRVLLSEAYEQSLTPDMAEAFGRSIKKVDSLQADIKGGKLKIALVGAFSDGKTSTVAGFLGHADSSMKIAESESSDEVVSYIPENIPVNVPPCEFVDTPGLFGQKFSKVTEEYISQAHIILYIVNATNPLKDSHRPMVEWLLRTLKKFDNTIFVINRMDDICDYTDSEDYDSKARTKVEYLRNNVARFCGINSDDAKVRGLNIVCITSNPGNKGLSDNGKGLQNYWLTAERNEKYEKYSRMPSLRRMVGEVLSQTLAEKLIQSSALSALMEEARDNCERLEEELVRLGGAVIPETKRTIDVLMDDVAKAKKDLHREIRPCREELETMEKKICDIIRCATRETFTAAVQDELGGQGDETGYKLQGRISDILAEHFENIVSSVSAKFSRDVDIGATNVATALNVVKTGVGTVSNLAKGVDKAMIFAGRDILGKIGIAIKFKPWQATKLAGFASKGIPMIGAGVSLVADIWSMVADARAEAKLADAKRGLIEAIQMTFKGVYDVLNSERNGGSEFYDTLAPQVIEMERGIEEAKSKLNKIELAHENCGVLRARLEVFWKDDKDGVAGNGPSVSKKGFLQGFWDNGFAVWKWLNVEVWDGRNE